METGLSTATAGKYFARLCIATLAPIITLSSYGSTTAAQFEKQPLLTWWQGKNASGTWLGLRPTLEDRGISLSGYWKSSQIFLTGGGRANRARNAFDEEIKFAVTLDLEKLAGIPGLSAYGNVRWRDGENINEFVGASPTFNPSALESGLGWRFGQAYFTWQSQNLFPAKNLLTLSAGWQNPFYFFAQQLLSKEFSNNTIVSSKGLGANNTIWSSSYAAWGGHLKLQPSDEFYAQAGLYMAIPEGSRSGNHGLDFAGYATDPGSNGLYYLGEIGFTPRIGSTQLPGKYALGGMYFGVKNKTFFANSRSGSYQLYCQADQMLWREPPPAATAANRPPLDEQGLHSITFLSFSPPENSRLPLYFHTGLLYCGLIPTRDADWFAIGFASGTYSADKIHAEEQAGLCIHQTYEAVFEIDYEAVLNRFASIKPFFEYLIRPDGTGQIPNASLLGLSFDVKF